MHEFQFKKSTRMKKGRRESFLTITAPNGEPLYTSETVANSHDAKQTLGNLIRAIQNGQFLVRECTHDITQDFLIEFVLGEIK